jgi:hypothetical protein
LVTTSRPPSVASRIGSPPASPARAPLLVAAAAALVGIAAAWYYARAGLTLSHYDARAHLVVARRVFDSLTPGWQQIGAVWLPLPHVLNMLPVQVDAWYRSGGSGVAISIASMALGAWALTSMLLRATGSWIAGATASALLILNPNVLYLQSTPMTEPLLFGTAMLAVALTARWIDTGVERAPTGAGLALAAACLTRYEAWPIGAALIALTALVLLRRGLPVRPAVRASARLAVYPALAVILFLANSRWTTGAWFISGSDVFVPDNTDALAQPLAAWRQVRDGLYRLSGSALVRSAYAAALVVALAFARTKTRASVALIFALAAAGALPWFAYVQGHPFRIRYDAPLVAACAALAGAAIGLLPSRIRVVLAGLLVAAAIVQSPPLDRTAPLIVESQLDAANSAGRAAVTSYLIEHHDGGTIMMSMGSLAHYMHDLSRAGFRLRDFLHEGNNELWTFALLRARGHVAWVAIEERAEGGDALFHLSRRNRSFLEGFERVAEGGGIALYRAN